MHWMTVHPVQCSLFETNLFCQNKLQKHLKSIWVLSPVTELQLLSGHIDWLALWWQGACKRTHLTLLEDDSTMQRKEWGLHSKSSVIGEHQSVCRSTKALLSQHCGLLLKPWMGRPKTIYRLHSHLCHNGKKTNFNMSWFGEAHPWSANQGVRAPSIGHGWLKQQGKALLPSQWISNTCRFVCIHKRQSMLPSRVHTGKCRPLLECYRKIRVSPVSFVCGNGWSGSNSICK